MPKKSRCTTRKKAAPAMHAGRRRERIWLPRIPVHDAPKAEKKTASSEAASTYSPCEPAIWLTAKFDRFRGEGSCDGGMW